MNIKIHQHRPARRAGFTLMEMLLSVVLTLFLMYGVAQIFSMVGNSVNDSRALLGISDRLRATKTRLELDLAGITCRMNPPISPGNGEGYFELIEGAVGPTVSVTTRAISTDEAGFPVEDTTVIDYDDILMFTTCTTTNELFTGRAITVTYDVHGIGSTNTVLRGENTKSRFAEIAWFVRGRTLYRRVKIITPNFKLETHTPPFFTLSCIDLYGGTSMNKSDLEKGVLGGLEGKLLRYESKTPPDPKNPDPMTIIKDLDNPVDAAFENLFDFSARFEGLSGDIATWHWVPNSLADLTKRENRMYHAQSTPAIITDYLTDRFPFTPHDTLMWQILGLPTLGETSNTNWMLYRWNCCTTGGPELPTLTLTQDTVNDLNGLAPTPTMFQLDFWNEPHPYEELDPITGNLTDTTLQAATGESKSYPHQRTGEDVILNNVIGFDVKVWDPDAPLISNGTTVLKPGDPGYPASYTVTTGNPDELTDLATNTDYDIIRYGAFVDLGHNYRPTAVDPVIYPPTSILSGPCNTKSGFLNPVASATWTDPPSTTPPFVYDTWSTHYEHDGIDQNATILPNYIDAGYDGLDNDADGIVDDVKDIDIDNDGVIGPNNYDLSELDTSPPYSVPLEAIQIKIRVFEPDSRQVREVTIVHRFSKN